MSQTALQVCEPLSAVKWEEFLGLVSSDNWVYVIRVILPHIVIRDQIRWKSKLFSHFIGLRPLWTFPFHNEAPADNGEDDKYFSIWSKRGLCWIKTGVFWHVVRPPSSTLLPIVFNTLLALSQWSHFEGKLFGGFFKAYIFVFLTLNLLSSLWVICLGHTWPMIMVGDA